MGNTSKTRGNYTITGIFTAASAVLTGALTAASATLTGALTAASAAITGAITAASVTTTGTLTGTNDISFQAPETINTDAQTVTAATHANKVVILDGTTTNCQCQIGALSTFADGDWIEFQCLNATNTVDVDAGSGEYFALTGTNATLTFNAAEDAIKIIKADVGGTDRWIIAAGSNNSVTLS